MGVKFGRFTGRNGHEYEVRISGASVTNGEVQLSSTPAYVAMAAGERKFCGYKSSTARVQILTDVPLVDLYASTPTSVMLSIEDVTDNVFEFDGYVTPFAFDQPYTGRLDAVTVNAVDRITANKDTKYTNLSRPQTEYGTDRNALDIVEIIAQRAGVERLVVHTNFDKMTDGNSSPLDVPVAQAGFLQDEVTNLQALNAICLFFGYTATCVGDTLYLWDERCFTNAPDQGKVANCNVYSWADDEDVWYRTEHYYDAQDSPLGEQLINTKKMLNDLSVTIERAYDGIQITPEGSDTSVLLPDVCADENMEDSTDRALGTSRRTYLDSGYIQYRTPRSSKILETGIDGLSDFPDNGVDWMKPFDSESYWMTGAIPIRYDYYTKEATPSPSDSEVAEYITGGDNRSMIWLRSAVETALVGQQKTEKRYSHTGGYVRVDLSLRAVGRSNWQNPEGENVNSSFERIKFIQLRCGEQFYKSTRSGGEWADDMDSPISVKAGKIVSNETASSFLSTGFVVKVPSGSQVFIELRGRGSATVTRDYYIESLRIEAVGDKINLENKQLRHVFSTSEKEMLNVSTMLTSRKSGVVVALVDGHYTYGVNARPSVVPAAYWNGGYMGRSDSESIPISGILMEQLRARYAEPHPAYTMTVEQLLQPYRPTWWGGNPYTVEAYERDLYNSTTKITLD